LNYFLLIPLYATLFNVPIEVYVNAGHALNAHVVDLKALIVLCVLPFNFIKGSLVTLLSGALFLRIGDQLNRY
ncbi:MAG: ECF transporter S component, partial [Clostridia bacterium]|nr:ECF transporter S component [Clostridia bacterium]